MLKLNYGIKEKAKKPMMIKIRISVTFGVAQRLKRLPPMWETRVQSLGREDPLEKEMATHSSILAWRIPWTEEPGGLQSMRSQESNTTEQLPLSLSRSI